MTVILTNAEKDALRRGLSKPPLEWHEKVAGDHSECLSGGCVITMDLCCGGQARGVCPDCDKYAASYGFSQD